MAKNENERIMTLHPHGKRGVNIEKSKYDSMRRAILRVVPLRSTGTPFKGLASIVEPHLDEDVFGPDTSVSWYLVAVKQDLEARGMLEQVPGVRPQHIRRVKGGKA